jgi:sialate O-acetylesterase
LIYEYAKGVFTMKTTMSLICLVSIFLGLVGCSETKESNAITPSASDLKLPALFSDHMVLQQKLACPVWGWASDGTKVTVEINGQRATATAKDRCWQVQLPALEAGGPYTLTVSTPQRMIELKDVLVGEVWVCSGQSNMEFPVVSSQNAQAEIAAAHYPNIRLFTVEKATSSEPLQDVTGQWVVCTPETVGDFSAVGYFFGRDLMKSGIQPIGLIDTTWGGTPAEAWTSTEALKSDPEFAPILARDADSKQIQAQLLKKYGTQLMTDERNADVIMSDTTALKKGWANMDADLSEWETMNLPTLWEEAGLNIDGVVWFCRDVNIPQAWAGRDLTLKLSTIDDIDLTYFNGAQIGKTFFDTPSPWMAPRIYTVPGKLVRTGKNVIAVRVLDSQGGGGIYPSNTPMQIGPADDTNPIDLSGPWHYRIERIMSLGSGQQNLPARLYNAMIAPLAPYGIKGAIWYQGESNADRAYQYRKLFAVMIQDWRRAWNIGDFPFYFVQLANYMQRKAEPEESAWAELREAQQMTLSLPHTGMAVIIDVGNPNDIHPRDKQTVGKRLALIAQARDYGRDIECSGPVYSSMTVENGQVRLHFDYVDSGLVAKDGPLTGFAIAGADRKFHWSEAAIEGKTIVVKSDKVAAPVAVRYAWADNPACNLYNGAGLPASPFRTDDWPGITINNK